MSAGHIRVSHAEDSSTPVYAGLSMARRHLVLLLIILLGAFAVRALWLDYTDIEGDEAFSYVFSIDTLEGIYKTTLAIAEPHPIPGSIRAGAIATGRSLLAQDIAMPEKAYSVPLADTLPIGALCRTCWHL